MSSENRSYSNKGNGKQYAENYNRPFKFCFSNHFKHDSKMQNYTCLITITLFEKSSIKYFLSVPGNASPENNITVYSGIE